MPCLDAIDLCGLINLKTIDFSFETSEDSDSENVEWVLTTLATLAQDHVLEGVWIMVKMQEGSGELLQDTPWGSFPELIRVIEQQRSLRLNFSISTLHTPK